MGTLEGVWSVLDETGHSTDLLESNQEPASHGHTRMDWRKPLLPHSFKKDLKHSQCHVSNVCFICNNSLHCSVPRWTAVSALLQEDEEFASNAAFMCYQYSGKYRFQS